MNKQSIKVTALEIITGKDLIRNPYAIHNKMPTQSITNILSETSLVDFDFHALINWGRKASVVNVPAVKPKIVMKFILAISGLFCSVILLLFRRVFKEIKSTDSII